MDKLKYQYEGVKWLVELELLNHPQVINTIRFNILLSSQRIKEVELLIYRENKSMLVLLDLTWIGRTFFRQSIFMGVQDVLAQLLPSFRFRVTDNPKIMEMAVEKVKQALTGGKNETTTNIIESTNKSTNASFDDSPDAFATAAYIAANSSLESNQEEQSKSTTEVCGDSSADDSNKE